MIPDWVIAFETPVLFCCAIGGFNAGRYLYCVYDNIRNDFFGGLDE